MQAITSGGKRYPTEYTCVARTTTRRTHNSDRADTKFLHQPVNGLMVHMDPFTSECRRMPLRSVFSLSMSRVLVTNARSLRSDKYQATISLLKKS